MKTRSRDFYVSDACLRALRDNENIDMCSFAGNAFQRHSNKVTVTFPDAPRTATITEDEFDEMLEQSFEELRAKCKEFYFVPVEQVKLIREKIFGGKK